jgi:hypothetical protein
LSLLILLEMELYHLPAMPTIFLELVNLEKPPNRCTIPIIQRSFQLLQTTMSRTLQVVVLLVHQVHLRLLWSNPIWATCRLRRVLFLDLQLLLLVVLLALLPV